MALVILEDINGGALVSSNKLGAFEKECSLFSEITFTGCVKKAKKEKYEAILLSCGFKLKKIEWLESVEFDSCKHEVLNFREVYTK